MEKAKLIKKVAVPKAGALVYGYETGGEAENLGGCWNYVQGFAPSCTSKAYRELEDFQTDINDDGDRLDWCMGD